jgi:peptidoglycan/LPS O-acetylase OafA/YrhL
MVKFPVRGAESAARALMMTAIGVMAGAASFTHMHDWTMRNSPAGTPEWFGWANAVVSELMPALALLEIRRRRRMGKPLGYPLAVLIGAGLLSLSAQVAQASPSWSGRGLAALPAVGFIVLTKMVFSGLGADTPDGEGQADAEARPAREHAGTSEAGPDRPAGPVAPPAAVRPVVVGSMNRPTSINGAVVNTR